MKQIPYATQWLDEEDRRAVENVLRSPYLTQGPLVAAFEAAVADYCRAKYAVAVSSGTAALHIACLAAGITKGDEVITSPITFVASANSVLYCGGKPVFADVLDRNAIIDSQKIEQNISKRTKAIIPVDFAGHPADLAQIKTIARNNKLIVIEDAAHSLGARYKGENIGSGKFADMTILSFHPVKHITTGEGGMVLTNNEKLYEKLKLLRVHGISREDGLAERQGAWYYEMQQLGYNYRITDFQCALGISQLKKLPRFLKLRREIAAQYNSAFSRCDELTSLSEEPWAESAYHLYVLRFNLRALTATRRQIFDDYRTNGIMTNVHYIPVYRQPYYQKLGYQRGLCPRAEKYYEAAITLPLYPKMSGQAIDRVIKATEKILTNWRK